MNSKTRYPGPRAEGPRRTSALANPWVPGTEAGDLLEAIDGQPVRNDRHVTQILYDIGIWTKAAYTVARENKIIEPTLVLAPRADRFLRQQEYLEEKRLKA